MHCRQLKRNTRLNLLSMNSNSLLGYGSLLSVASAHSNISKRLLTF
nr:MAG TPA: hypothetical protein [Caudoviricetes sp.]